MLIAINGKSIRIFITNTPHRHSLLVIILRDNIHFVNHNVMNRNSTGTSKNHFVADKTQQFEMITGVDFEKLTCDEFFNCFQVHVG